MALAGCLCMLSACLKQLDKFPEAALSDASFWKTTNDLRDACNNLYFCLPEIGYNDEAIWSDDGYSSNGPQSISDGSRLAPATSADWINNYKYIRRCNSILEKSGLVTGNATEVDRYRAEAYFFRAWVYFEMVKRFGDVPLILRTFDVDDTLAVAHRTNREQVLDTAYADLDFAIAHLPAAPVPAAEYGRITKGAAQALKARIGLFEGTFNKFHQQGDAARHLQIAVAATDAMIKDGIYSLFSYAPKPDSSYYQLFQAAGDGAGNKESILVRLYGENLTNSIASHNYVRGRWGGSVTPTRTLMDAYLYVDGLPLGKSPYTKPQVNTLTEFDHRDPRMDMTVFNKTHWFLNGLYQPTFQNSPTGYKSRKFFVAEDWEINQSYVDNIIIRYGEILLIYAEATYELNGSITDADLNRSINLLRQRVNMPALTNGFVTANSLNMRDEIRRERRIELALEGDFRYWDLIRWKTAETALPQAVLGAKYFEEEQLGITNPQLTPEGFVIVQSAAKRKFDPERDYLWPLGTQDLGLDENLEQNPKW